MRQLKEHLQSDPDILPNFFESATQCEIVEIAKSVLINTAASHDKVPMWSVKESINYISEPLTYIYY